MIISPERYTQLADTAHDFMQCHNFKPYVVSFWKDGITIQGDKSDNTHMLLLFSFDIDGNIMTAKTQFNLLEIEIVLS